VSGAAVSPGSSAATTAGADCVAMGGDGGGATSASASVSAAASSARYGLPGGGSLPAAIFRHYSAGIPQTLGRAAAAGSIAMHGLKDSNTTSMFLQLVPLGL
jgi:hypothetical protein